MTRNINKIVIMKIILSFFIFGLVVNLPFVAMAQSTLNDWNVFDMGFARTDSSNIHLKSAIGQNFVGDSKITNTWIRSGFLVHPRFRGQVTEVIEKNEPFPTHFELGQNYPNPFNPNTAIRYQLPENSKVCLRVYNTLGQMVITLTDQLQEAGFKSVDWNASNLASGVYFYRLEATSASDPSKTFTQVKKMILLQ